MFAFEADRGQISVKAFALRIVGRSRACDREMKFWAFLLLTDEHVGSVSC
jgi:hypothetical protein